MMNISYERINGKIRPLIRVLNESGLEISAICQDYIDDKRATIILYPVNEIKYRILNLSDKLSDINIDIFQWHRLIGLKLILRIEKP